MIPSMQRNGFCGIFQQTTEETLTGMYTYIIYIYNYIKSLFKNCSINIFKKIKLYQPATAIIMFRTAVSNYRYFVPCFDVDFIFIYLYVCISDNLQILLLIPWFPIGSHGTLFVLRPLFSIHMIWLHRHWPVPPII